MVELNISPKVLAGDRHWKGYGNRGTGDGNVITEARFLAFEHATGAHRYRTGI